MANFYINNLYIYRMKRPDENRVLINLVSITLNVWTVLVVLKLYVLISTSWLLVLFAPPAIIIFLVLSYCWAYYKWLVAEIKRQIRSRRDSNNLDSNT
jgi:ABC-type tungstate transport system substrate-binding protein